MSFQATITQIVRNTLYLRLIPLITIFLFVCFIFVLWRERDFLLDLELKEDYMFLLVLVLAVGVLLRIFANYFGTWPEYIYTAIANTIYRTGNYGICIHQPYCFPSYKPYTLYPTILSFIYSALEGVSFQAARSLSIFFGSLSILGGALFAKIRFDNLEAVIYAMLITIFPLHVIYSKSMEAHAIAIFFMFLSMAFLWASKENINLFPLAVFSTILAVLSKVYHLVLIFPLLFFMWKSKERIWEKLNKGYIFVFVLVTIIFFPIYYNFLFIHDVAVAQSFSMGPNFLKLLRILGQQPVSVALVLISLSGVALSLYKRKNIDLIFLLALYSLPIITHQRPTYRLWLSPLLLIMFFGSETLSKLTRKISDRFDISKSKILPTMFIGLLVLLFCTTPLENHYYFQSEKILKEDMKSMAKEGTVYSFRGDLLSSLTGYPVVNLNFQDEKEDEVENPIFFTSSDCSSQRFRESIPWDLSRYELTKIKKLDRKYKFCIFTSKTI